MSLNIESLQVGHTLRGISFSVDDAEVVAVVGASGSGKTTLLQTIAGFITPDAGAIEIDGEDVGALSIAQRPTGVMLEQPTLFDMTVRKNIEFALDDTNYRDRQWRDIVDITMSSLNISGLASRYPQSLSGGQAQRVALARTLVRRPRVLLLDEPLVHIELAVRADIHQELLSQVHRLGLSVLYVTHDIADAASVAQRIIVLDQGRIIQDGTPQELFFKPANAIVARLMGLRNVFVADEVATLVPQRFLAGGGTVVIPPSSISLTVSENVMVYGAVGQVTHCVFQRSHYAIQLETEIGTIEAWCAKPYELGTFCEVSVDYAWEFADTER